MLRSIYHRAPPDLFRSAMTTNVVVSVGDARKCVTCAPGMLVNELRYVLGAAFDVDAKLIAGVVSEDGVCSPLSMLSRAPSAFGMGVFALLLKRGADGVDEQREVVEEPSRAETAGDDDTAMACDVYAWCTVCASSDSCVEVESVAATAMHDLYKLENRCKSRDACLPPHTHGS